MDLNPRNYENFTVNDDDIRNIVLSYLVHNCFKETAQMFLSDVGVEPVVNVIEMEKRKAICTCVLEGNSLKAIELTEELSPKLFESNMDLCFDLLTLHFIDLVRARKGNEALEFGQKRFTSFGKDSKYRERLEEFMALLAYEDPEKSPMFHLLSPDYREAVADKLNRAILTQANLPAYTSLERIIQQVTAAAQYLQQDLGKDGCSAFSLKAFLNR